MWCVAKESRLNFMGTGVVSIAGNTVGPPLCRNASAVTQIYSAMATMLAPADYMHDPRLNHCTADRHSGGTRGT